MQTQVAQPSLKELELLSSVLIAFDRLDKSGSDSDDNDHDCFYLITRAWERYKGRPINKEVQ